MNHVMLTDRELAAVVRALDQPHHTMANHWREELQAKVRRARVFGRRAMPPRLVQQVTAVFDEEGGCLALIIDADEVKGFPGWKAIVGTWVPNGEDKP